jgi:1A family penicillin-binding protein
MRQNDHPTRPQRPLRVRPDELTEGTRSYSPSQPTPVPESDRPTRPREPLAPACGAPIGSGSPEDPVALPRRRATSPDGPILRVTVPLRSTTTRCQTPGNRVWQGIVFVLLGIGLLSLGLLTVGLIGYYTIARQLPPPEDLQQRSLTFASTQIYDRDGRMMWELMDPNAGRRTWVPLNRIAPAMVAATIATEDRYFYANVGVDPIAVIRAVYYNVMAGEIVSGGSTITQQLARNVLLSPDERSRQTLARKVREAVLAVELARRYPKDKILEIYLNQVYYGNLAYGVEAASQTYFGKSAADLNLAEAALLAGLPQSPAAYDPIASPGRAKRRQQVTLGLMVEAGYVTPAEAVAAYQQYLEYSPPPAQFEAPHFVTYVRQLLEARYGPDLLYHEPGLKVQITLDPRIQAIAEEEVAKQVRALKDVDATNGAAVVLDVETGEILAMVGSADFNDEAISGQVNMALQPRQPGSAIKPLTYLAAFERGWTPATLVMDVPVEYPDGAGGVYRPVNYDGRFRGPVLVREALANSLNIPAVKALEFVGTPALKEMAQRLGITTLTQDDYGLSLALGSGEVSLLELVSAYQTMANGGLRVPPVALLRVTDGLGHLIEEHRSSVGSEALRPEHAYLITHIMADNQARVPLFGADSPLKLARPAAAKTGTTNDFRDSWTIGYTADIVVGVWVGNADNHPMRDLSGLSGAAPIWHGIIERSLVDMPARDFVRPPTIIEMEICSDSGTVPSSSCPSRTNELFAQDQPPLGPEQDMHRLMRVDTRGNCLANDYAPADVVEERDYQVYPPDGRQWAVEHGIEDPPPPCPPELGKAQASITWPSDGQEVEGIIAVQGVALAADFSHYIVEYGVGWSPEAFGPVAGPIDEPIEGGPLAEWDTRQQPNGPYTMRVVVFDKSGDNLEGRVGIVVNNPMPTATPLLLLEPMTSDGHPLPGGAGVEQAGGGLRTRRSPVVCLSWSRGALRLELVEDCRGSNEARSLGT